MGCQLAGCQECAKCTCQHITIEVRTDSKRIFSPFSDIFCMPVEVTACACNAIFEGKSSKHVMLRTSCLTCFIASLYVCLLSEKVSCYLETGAKVSINLTS